MTTRFCTKWVCQQRVCFVQESPCTNCPMQDLLQPCWIHKDLKINICFFDEYFQHIKKNLLPSVVKLELLLVWFSYCIGNNLNCVRHSDSFLPQSGCCPVQSLIVSAYPVTSGIFSTRPFSHQSHLVWFLKQDVTNCDDLERCESTAEPPTASNWIPGGLAIPEAPTAAPTWGKALGNKTCKQETENVVKLWPGPTDIVKDSVWMYPIG